MNQSDQGLPHFYTLREVADATRQSYASVLRHAHSGKLRTLQPGGVHKRLVTEAAFQTYVYGAPVEGGESR